MINAPAQRRAANPGLTGWVLLVSAVTLFACHMSGAFACLYEQGQMPVKPRDITLALVSLILGLMWFHRPSFAPLALGLLTIPTIRVVDAGILVRYTNDALGDHSLVVFTLLLVWLVVLVAVTSMGSELGQKIALYAAIAVILIDTGSLVYESMGYAKYTSIPGRVSGFLRQPNDSIIVMCLMLGCAFTLNKSFWLNAALIAIAAVGVVLTLSRSGMMVFSVLVCVFVLLNLREHIAKILLVTAIAIPLATAGLAWFMHQAMSASFGTDTNIKNRIEGIFGGSTDKLASDERMKDLTDGWEAVTASPLVGYGTGCASYTWQPHNQWVAVWLDIGIIGPLLYATILVTLTILCILNKGKAIYAVIPLWMFSVFSQNLVEMACYWFTASVAVYELTTGRIRIALRRSSDAIPAQPQPL